MSGRSENGQFDVVTQAEEVVEAYIARYFSFDSEKPRQNGRDTQRYHRGKIEPLEKSLLFVAGIGLLILSGLITLLVLYF